MRRSQALPIECLLPCLAFVLLTTVALSPLRAAEPPAAGMKEGYAALQANDLPKAAKAFQAVVARDPGNAEAWFRLGLAQREMGQHDAAIQSLGSALAKGYAPPLVTTSLAITYVAKKDYDKAFEYLERAVKLGVQPGVLQTHPGLAAIRDDPRFKTLVAAADKASHPCENDPRYRAFDFWAGEWDVYVGGQLAGTNVIERVSRACALIENWSGGGGGGKSLNYFDPADGKWRQDWVGDGGQVTHYAGGFADGAMRMAGESHLPNGVKQLARGTWARRPDGSIHQLLEGSRDGGKTWGVGFDGIYVKKGSPPPASP